MVESDSRWRLKTCVFYNLHIFLFIKISFLRIKTCSIFVNTDIENKQIIITGDLNCNLLEQAKSTYTAKLLDIFDIYLLKQHIQSPTRVTGSSQSLIDVIITYHMSIEIYAQ